MKVLRFEEAIDKENPVLDLDIATGSVNIVTHDLLTAVIVAEVDSDDITVTQQANILRVRSHANDMETNWVERLFNGRWQNRTRLTIHIPAHCEIQARTNTGQLHINGIAAPVSARMNTGELTLTDIGGPIYAKVLTGKLSYQGSLSDDHHRFEAITGNIEFRLHKEPNTQISASVVTGKVKCRLPLQNRKENNHLTGSSVRGLLGNGNGHLKAKVITGSIQLAQTAV